MAEELKGGEAAETTTTFTQPELPAAEMSDVEAVMRFNPTFEEPKASPSSDEVGADTLPGTTGDTVNGGTGAEDTISAAGDELTKPNTPAGSPTPEQILLAQKDQVIEALMAARGEAKAEPKAAAPTEPDLTQLYNLTVPDKLVQALASEDPVERKIGIEALASGVGMAVHKTVMNMVSTQLNSLTTNFPSMITNHFQEMKQAEAVFNDFYGTYEQFNKPELYPLIQQLGAKVMQDLKTSNWTPAVRDEIASRLAKTMGITLAKGGTKGATQSKAPAAPHMMGGNKARPAVSRDQGDEIADVLGL